MLVSLTFISHYTCALGGALKHQCGSKDTTVETLSAKNAQAWVSMISY